MHDWISSIVLYYITLCCIICNNTVLNLSEIQLLKILIYTFQIELLEMEKNQLQFQCEGLKGEIVQLKAPVPQMVAHANDPVPSNLEDNANYSDGERYMILTIWPYTNAWKSCSLISISHFFLPYHDYYLKISIPLAFREPPVQLYIKRNTNAFQGNSGAYFKMHNVSQVCWASAYPHENRECSLKHTCTLDGPKHPALLDPIKIRRGGVFFLSVPGNSTLGNNRSSTLYLPCCRGIPGVTFQKGNFSKLWFYFIRNSNLFNEIALLVLHPTKMHIFNLYFDTMKQLTIYGALQ